MKVSTKGRYGLRVMLELAVSYGSGPMAVDLIAEKQDLSAKYIHVLVAGLRAAGLVRAIRGPGGGYELTRPPETITLLDVITALEGPTVPVECVADTSVCSRTDRCAARDVWCEIAEAVDGILAGFTLAELAARQADKDEEALGYCI